MNTETAALVYATYQAHGDVGAIPAGPNPGRINYNGNDYELTTDPNGMRDYLEAKGLRENPLKVDGAENNRLWTAGVEAALSAAEQALFQAGQRGTIDTNASKHAAAILLAHLRAAKGNTALDDAANNWTTGDVAAQTAIAAGD